MPDLEASERAEEMLGQQMKNHDSMGGVIECVMSGVPAGIGEPVFGKLDAALAEAVMSIGAVKGIEIGDGFETAHRSGSANNDAFHMDANGKVAKKTNHAGGILGGISDGSPIVLRAAFKPTPSIFSEQETVNRLGEEIKVQIKGRHDPIIVPRAVVVVESMCALTLVDKMFAAMTSRMDRIAEFYGKSSSLREE
jgi:chorismate synthase